MSEQELTRLEKVADKQLKAAMIAANAPMTTAEAMEYCGIKSRKSWENFTTKHGISPVISGLSYMYQPSQFAHLQLKHK